MGVFLFLFGFATAFFTFFGVFFAFVALMVFIASAVISAGAIRIFTFGIITSHFLSFHILYTGIMYIMSLKFFCQDIDTRFSFCIQRKNVVTVQIF